MILMLQLWQDDGHYSDG
uniref:Uncharacterized protein n=1 Tax=Rhizophora mucronata TaxID=61149 RepID=A0A2P2K1T7_RHIMU